MTRKLPTLPERSYESMSDLMNMPVATPEMRKEILRRRAETRRRLEDVLIEKANESKDRW